MSKSVNVCRYCGDKFKGKTETADMCHKCYSKLPLVRELCAIGRKIKAGTKK